MNKALRETIGPDKARANAGRGPYDFGTDWSIPVSSVEEMKALRLARAQRQRLAFEELFEEARLYPFKVPPSAK